MVRFRFLTLYLPNRIAIRLLDGLEIGLERQERTKKYFMTLQTDFQYSHSILKMFSAIPAPEVTKHTYSAVPFFVGLQTVQIERSGLFISNTID